MKIKLNFSKIFLSLSLLISFFLLSAKENFSFAASDCNWSISQTPIPIHTGNGTILLPQASITLTARLGRDPDANTPIGVYVSDPSGTRHFVNPGLKTDEQGRASFTINYEFSQPGNYTIEVGAKGIGNFIVDLGTWCKTTLRFNEDGDLLEKEPYSVCQGDLDCEKCIRSASEAIGGEEYTYEGGGSWTAIGCIPSGSPTAFVKWLFPFVLGIAGGIATILMLIGGFLVLTSSGDPKRVESGRNMLTSALMGLVLIVFSLFLLRAIGVDLLQIPGLN